MHISIFIGIIYVILVQLSSCECAANNMKNESAAQSEHMFHGD